MTDHMPVDDPAVAAILAAAAAPAEGPVPGEAAALAAYRSVYRPHRGVRMSRYSEKAKLIAAAVFGGVVVISGAATAATGSLPIVHGHSTDHPTPASTHSPDGDDSQDGVEDSTDTETTDSTDANTNDDNGQGSAISDLAHQTPPPGTTRGQMVCTVASDHHCKAGQDHGQNNADSHGKAHQSTNNSANHRQNTTVHGKLGVNGQANVPHGQANVPHGKANVPHGKAHSSS